MAAPDITFASKSGLLNVKLNFVKTVSDAGLKKSDSLLIVGKGRDLRQIQVSHVSSLLTELQIPDQWFTESMTYLCPPKKDLAATANNGNSSEESSTTKPTTGTSVSWLNKLLIHKITDKCSRNNTPSRAHLFAKCVKQNSYASNQLILVPCERKNSVALACAIARVFPLYSSKTSETNAERTVTVAFLFVDQLSTTVSNANDEEIKCFNVLAQSVRLSASIIDKPCAEMNTDHFLEEVRKVGKELGLEPTVVQDQELEKRGFGGLYNVGKGALVGPKLVVLSSLKPQAKRTVAWVGKGIVYDTGGLAIKSRVNMCTMKCDCGGAAGILGAFYAAVRLGFEDNLHAVFCLAENAVGPNSYRHDDIIRLYSGKTVEITNTDAEGRLVLGDGVAYACKDLKADIIVDMATLTGAQGAATGKLHAALLTNNEEWERELVNFGKSSGDLCFPVIFAPEIHFSEYNSEVADMTNSITTTTNANCSCAGLFVHSHLSSDFSGVWVHIDMAYPVTDGDRATGYGVALLNTMFADSSSSELLRSIGPATALPLKKTAEQNDE